MIIDSIHPGPFCNFQAIGLNTGDLGSCLWTLVVAITTFLSIVGPYRDWVTEKSTSGKGRWILTGAIWAFVLFVGVFGLIFIQPLHPEKGPYCTNLFKTF
jgi:hypothetical protein